MLQYTFLNPREIPAERRRMLLPDDRVVAVEHIPEWYWYRNERIVGHVQDFLRADVSVFTYFTCEEEADGTLFHTVCALPYAAWEVVATSRSVLEALEKHASIRAAWWVGAEQYRYVMTGGLTPLRVPLPGFEIPPHPLDDLP